MSALGDLLAEGREFAASEIFTDTCQASRSGSVSGDVDPVTWLGVDSGDVPFYTGPVRLKSNRIQNPMPSDIGGEFVVVQSITASVPYGSPVFKVDDTLIITGSELDPGRIGARFRVTSLQLSSQVTAQRFQVEAVVG